MIYIVLKLDSKLQTATEKRGKKKGNDLQFSATMIYYNSHMRFIVINDWCLFVCLFVCVRVSCRRRVRSINAIQSALVKNDGQDDSGGDNLIEASL